MGQSVVGYHRRKGHQPVGGSSLLVDSVTSQTAVFAFSVDKKLRSAYSGNIFRLVRASDSTQQDIGFSGDVVDEAAVNSFCSGTTCKFVTVYDQMGGSTHLTMATDSRRPVAYTGGAFTGEMRCSASTDHHMQTASNFGLAQNVTWTVFLELGTIVDGGSVTPFIFTIGGGSGVRFAVTRGTSATATTLHTRNSAGNTAVSGSPTFAANDKLFLEKTSTTANSTSVDFSVNNGSDNAGGSSTIGTVTNLLNLFNTSAVANCSGISISNFVGWLGNITSGERTDIHAA